ncbi:c-type cytochrome [Muriicola sp. Z0-33]|nr:c-type cytochrome [Muriicola sp. Z0-33]
MKIKKLISFSCLILCIAIIVSCTNDKEAKGSENTTEIAFDIPDGFVLDELYRPSENEQGSWVALANGPDDLIYACDQYGKIYRFNRPGEAAVLAKADIDSVNLDIGQAHGLLWAYNSLFVAVNKRWDDDVPDEEEFGSGVYKLTDTNGDGKLDNQELLLKLNGAGEHGPHSFVLGPEGDYIYFIAGNHVEIPEPLKKNTRLPATWGEDNLFPPYLDARGHANDIKAPGGWIAKFKPDGQEWEILSAGYRNPFDMAFNQDGELFAYDADMEWDIGMPWYRPTRICHVTSASEYGWRTGSGKWPEYYPDNLPAVHNLEQGSPTAVLGAAKLNFPSRYKNGLFVMDWSFGTVYFANLKPKGSSYTAEREEFLSGTPLPLTDMIAGKDGHMYFATGGRRLDSRLYRLRYTGTDNGNSEITQNQDAASLRTLRHRLENYHNIGRSEEAVKIAWEHLGHEDRFIRYASRIVLEQQPLALWQDRFFAENDITKTLEAGIAFARSDSKNFQSRILNKLNQLKLEQLSDYQKISLLRNYALLFIRQGEPNENDRVKTAANLNSYFPHANNRVNRELGQLLLYLKSEGVTEQLVLLLDKHTKEKTVAEGVEMLSEEATLRSEQYGPLIREVIEKMPPSEAIYYGMLLSHAKEGWTKELREKYFLWFYDVLAAKGGMSFKAYMENVRLKAMSNIPKSEMAYFEEISGTYSPSTAVADLPQPIGPGGQYSGNDMGDIVWGGMDNYKGNIAAGERAYKAAMCILCHRMRGEGGATGPDLTQAHSKFGAYDMLFAIYSPNDEISDQYANTLFNMNNGKKIAGRVLSEQGDSIRLAPNPFNEAYTINLAKSDIESRGPSPISPMPSGLLNRLSQNEIVDLFAYLRSGGDEDHEIYKGKETEGE